MISNILSIESLSYVYPVELNETSTAEPAGVDTVGICCEFPMKTTKTAQYLQQSQHSYYMKVDQYLRRSGCKKFMPICFCELSQNHRESDGENDQHGHANCGL